MLADLTTHLSLVEFTDLETHWGRRAATISAQTATIDAAQLDALVRRANDWLWQLNKEQVRFDVDRLAIRGADANDAVEFHDVQVRATRDAASGVKAQLFAHLSENDAGAPAVRISLQQLADGGSRITRATIDCRGVELPSWLFAAAGPVMASCGTDAAFSGAVQLDWTGGVLGGRAAGQIDDADLAAMLPVGSPHVARGRTTVTLHELRWRGRQIESFAGSVRATGVEVSWSLVEAAVKQLYCEQPSVVTTEMIAVDRLACEFRLNRQGLTLTGELNSESNLPQGCIAESGGRPLVMQPKYVDLPAGAWVQFVAAAGTSWLPATQEAVDLAERLPLPTSPESR